MKATLILVLIFLISILDDLSAFTLNNSVGATFSNDQVSLHVASEACQNIGLTNSELLDLAQDAVNTYWNTVSMSRLKLTKGSIRSLSSNFRTDPLCSSGSGNSCDVNTNLLVNDNIVISCNTNAATFPNTNIIAASLPNNISGTTINGALVLINDNAGNLFQDFSYDEKLSVLAHEIGHAFGLGHSPVTDSLMHSDSSSSRRHLGWDDIDGVTYLYPKEQPISACGTVNITTNNNNSGQFSFVVLLFLGAFLSSVIFSKKNFS